MPNTIKALMVIGFSVVLVACGQQEEEVHMDEEPMVMEEPAMGKL